jgi:hypothetical protein
MKDRCVNLRAMQFDFGFKVRPQLRLGEIEEILRAAHAIVPSRPTLVAMCEDGTLEGQKTRFGWVVYEDSFKAWVKSLQQQAA